MSQPQVSRETRDWSTIPSDVLSYIATLLSPSNGASMRCTCKDWKNDLSLPLPPPSESYLEDSSSPWLFTFPARRPCKIFSPFFNQSFKFNLPCELHDYALECVNDGWCLMFSHETQTYLLFNPSTKDMFDQIPPHGHGWFQYVSFTFPSKKRCQIVGVGFNERCSKVMDAFGEWWCRTCGASKTCGMTRICGIWRLGRLAWETYYLPETPVSFYPSNATMISCGNRFLCLAGDGCVATFSVKNRHGTWIVRNMPPDPNPKIPRFYHPVYFVEGMKGSLFGIFQCMETLTVKVLKLNLEQEIWEEVEHLGNQMLLVSYGKCYSEKTNNKALRNKIIFPLQEPKTGAFILYSLATKKLCSLNGKFSNLTASGLKHFPYHCSWFRPAGYQFKMKK